MSSGASPGLIAGTSDFPSGEEVLHDLNGRSWLPAFWQVAEATSNFRWLSFIVFCYFCAMRLRVCVYYMFNFGAGGVPVLTTQTRVFFLVVLRQCLSDFTIQQHTAE